MKKTTFSLLAAIALVLSPMVSMAQLKCYSLQAPTKTIEGMKKLAILNFEDREDVNWRYNYSTNDYGSQLADYMIGYLLEEHRGVTARGENYMERYTTNVYTIVERGEIDKVMQEQSLGASGAVSDGDAAAVGKLLGLDVIITGGYSKNIATKSSKNPVKNKEGRITGYSYSYTKTATVEVTMKIISVETGEILSLQAFNDKAKKTASSSKSYSEAQGRLASDQALMGEVLKKMSFKMVSHFTPVFVYQALDVEKSKVKDYKDDYKAAKDAVKEKDLSKAFAIIKTVVDADQYDAAMTHNMGVLFEAVGNYDQAIKYHQMSYDVDPSKAHKKSLERAKNSKEALDELGKLGVDISPYVFDESAGADLNMEKVKIAGKSKERIDVYADANKGSDVVAKVPGGTEYEVLGREGSWVKIKLLGGKEGWIPESSLD